MQRKRNKNGLILSKSYTKSFTVSVVYYKYHCTQNMSWTHVYKFLKHEFLFTTLVSNSFNFIPNTCISPLLYESIICGGIFSFVSISSTRPRSWAWAYETAEPQTSITCTWCLWIGNAFQNNTAKQFVYHQCSLEMDHNCNEVCNVLLCNVERHVGHVTTVKETPVWAVEVKPERLLNTGETTCFFWILYV